MYRVSQISSAVARIKIDIDEDLLLRAMRATGLLTNKATVEEALRVLLRIREQVQAGNALKGLGWEGDLEEMRTGQNFSST
jgi:Arc/MetJ family transcription regulator